MQLFETLRMEAGKLPRLSYHKARMERSAARLGFKFDGDLWQMRSIPSLKNIQ